MMGRRCFGQRVPILIFSQTRREEECRCLGVLCYPEVSYPFVRRPQKAYELLLMSILRNTNLAGLL